MRLTVVDDSGAVVQVGRFHSFTSGEAEWFGPVVVLDTDPTAPLLTPGTRVWVEHIGYEFDGVAQTADTEDERVVVMLGQYEPTPEPTPEPAPEPTPDPAPPEVSP